MYVSAISNLVHILREGDSKIGIAAHKSSLPISIYSMVTSNSHTSTLFGSCLSKSVSSESEKWTNLKF